GDVAEKFYLYLVRRMETICRAVGFPQRTEHICGNAVKIEIIATVHSASAVCARAVWVFVARPMAIRGAVVPVIFVKPSVPAFVQEIARARCRIGIGHSGIVKWAVRDQLIWTT